MIPRITTTSRRGSEEGEREKVKGREGGREEERRGKGKVQEKAASGSIQVDAHGRELDVRI